MRRSARSIRDWQHPSTEKLNCSADGPDAMTRRRSRCVGHTSHPKVTLRKDPREGGDVRRERPGRLSEASERVRFLDVVGRQERPQPLQGRGLYLADALPRDAKASPDALERHPVFPVEAKA